MEEWIGEHWHRWATRRAAASGAHPDAAVALADVRRAVTLLLHAGGARLRLAEAVPVSVGGPRTVWQRVAGSGRRAPLAQLDDAVLALPAVVDRFDDPVLNRDLYLWWSALGSRLDPAAPWVRANRDATARALADFPGLHDRWARLWAADRALRDAGPPPTGAAAAAERRLRSLWDAGGPSALAEADAPGPGDVAPLWTWIVPMGVAAAVDPSGADGGARRAPDAAADTTARLAPGGRRRARPVKRESPRAPLLLAAKTESLTTVADPLAVDRAADDADDGLDAVAAEELERLAVQRDGGSVAARVRFDLDLPSAAADDLPVGPGERLPEWDPRAQRLVPDRVTAQAFAARVDAAAAAWTPPAGLRAEAARVRRRLDLQRAAPRWQRARPDGEDLDLDAWVRHAGQPAGTGAAAVYRQRTRAQRELATLLLADLSLSTDAHANDRQRVIDVIRESLWVFGEALAASGDAFGLLGFSSVKRRLRLHPLKDLDEPWGLAVLPRLGALKPGYYTRMGAAIRAGTRRLQDRPERQRLLLLLTDGKPHDLDGYEGRLGLEDTRQAVLEARRAGLVPFAVSIDDTAPEVLPALFGRQGWTWVRRPEELPRRLAGLVAQLAR